MMRSFAILTLLALLLPARGQDEPQSLRGTQLRLTEESRLLEDEAQELEATAGPLPETNFDPQAPMPERAPGQSAAVADGGLVIDNEHSRLIYLGNVRLSDPVLQLRAAKRLYLDLPKEEKNETSSSQPSPAAPQLASSTAEESVPAEPAAPAAPQPETPAYLVVQNAAIDVPGSRLLLEGLPTKPSIRLARGKDLMELNPAANGAPAHVFANAEGLALVEGSNMRFIWHDEAGRPYRLEAAVGPVIYSAREQSITVFGPARLVSDSATLECDTQLYIRFAATDATPAREKTPFAAFASARFKEIQSAYARGHVALVTPATDTRPAGTARGDSLEYNAAESTCTLSGRCSLAYGGFTLHETDAQGRLSMTADGSIALSATEPLSGTYERPAAEPDTAPLSGVWHSGNTIAYSASDNCVTFPNGFRARDVLSSFSCTGIMQLYLEPRANSKPMATKPGLPRLVIAQQGGVRRVVASGDVRMDTIASGRQPACALSSDTLDATIPTAEAILTTSDGGTADVRYGAYALSARAAENGQAILQLHNTGDVAAVGERIFAALPTEKGDVLMECATSLHLQRVEGRLVLGPDSKIESPDGILTANAPLVADLATNDTPPPAPKGYPQLAYNFTGLRRATTPGGGTLRTAQASLECQEEISLELAEGTSPAADPRRNLRAATATGRVAIAGKDATGRLMRASGDRLNYDPATGNFYLRGSIVTLADRFNTHTSTGAGACVTIDPHNNVRITGQHQTTSANHLLQQLENNKRQ